MESRGQRWGTPWGVREGIQDPPFQLTQRKQDGNEGVQLALGRDGSGLGGEPGGGCSAPETQGPLIHPHGGKPHRESLPRHGAPPHSAPPRRLPTRPSHAHLSWLQAGCDWGRLRTLTVSGFRNGTSQNRGRKRGRGGAKSLKGHSLLNAGCRGQESLPNLPPSPAPASPSALPLSALPHLPFPKHALCPPV